jgi:hypothetical protein
MLHWWKDPELNIPIDGRGRVVLNTPNPTIKVDARTAHALTLMNELAEQGWRAPRVGVSALRGFADVIRIVGDDGNRDSGKRHEGTASPTQQGQADEGDLRPGANPQHDGDEPPRVERVSSPPFITASYRGVTGIEVRYGDLGKPPKAFRVSTPQALDLLSDLARAVSGSVIDWYAGLDE